jgi:hypothetical protein
MTLWRWLLLAAVLLLIWRWLRQRSRRQWVHQTVNQLALLLVLVASVMLLVQVFVR